MVTLPLFGVVNALHLNDTHLILILLYATFFVSLGTILMRTFIDQIPYELDEAAMVDGANRATILWTVGHSRALHPVGESLRRNPFALSLSKSPSTSSGQASTGSAGTAK